MKTTMKTIGLTAVATLTLVGCGGGSNGDVFDTPHPYDAPPISEAKKAEYLNIINQARSVGRTCGKLGYFPPAPPVVWSDTFYKSAYEHAQDMATTGHYEHSGSGTNSDWTAQVQELGHASDPSERCWNNGYDNMNGCSELIAYGDSSFANAMKRWLVSDGHCVGIMDDYLTEMGAAEVDRYYVINN